ncbi:hypothetical protein BN381_330010 [Candidatus Microthrix parvicella RN1]|uniref:Uncharacterized protein n=1 Tax=Candidatus Neomicrothrix parvicella RN1 TaxID=1229780 RepID=R4Z029_9ACTN|nr:hypothetical protein BN381_330010 [Candidatus Microthrix parvicella RN1]
MIVQRPRAESFHLDRGLAAILRGSGARGVLPGRLTVRGGSAVTSAFWDHGRPCVT